MRLAPVFLAASLSMAGTASAQTIHFNDLESQSRTEIVKYADLDLSRPEGRAVLLNRVTQAASLVCNGAPTTLSDFTRWDEYRACVFVAVKSGMDQVQPTFMAVSQPAAAQASRIARK